MIRPLKIGSLQLSANVLCAPLCDVTDYTYRRLLHWAGCPLVYSEMISSEALVRTKNLTNYRFTINHPDVRPYGIQISGKDPLLLSEMVKRLNDLDIDLIDLNMGCPVRKVVSKGCGSALLQSPQRARKIFTYMRMATNKPLTVKIRAGWNIDSINCVEIAKMAEGEGLDAITIHGRTATGKYEGAANWNYIKMVKEAVVIPVIGNGDLLVAEDAHRMLRETGCDGVMVARGAIGSPWIFREIMDPTFEVTLSIRHQMIHTHLKLLREAHDERYTVIRLKKFLGGYTKGLPRHKAMMQQVYHSTSSQAITEAVDAYFEEIAVTGQLLF